MIDYKSEDFESKLRDYDVVLHSNRDTKVLEKSLRVLKSGGQLISLIGPPTPEFAKKIGLPWYLQWTTKFLSSGIRRKADEINVRYTFLFMRPEGQQLGQITKLIEEGAISPVLDKTFPFEQVNEAMQYVESGRSK